MNHKSEEETLNHAPLLFRNSQRQQLQTPKAICKSIKENKKIFLKTCWHAPTPPNANQIGLIRARELDCLRVCNWERVSKSQPNKTRPTIQGSDREMGHRKKGKTHTHFHGFFYGVWNRRVDQMTSTSHIKMHSCILSIIIKRTAFHFLQIQRGAKKGCL